MRFSLLFIFVTSCTVNPATDSVPGVMSLDDFISQVTESDKNEEQVSISSSPPTSPTLPLETVWFLKTQIHAQDNPYWSVLNAHLKGK